MNLMCISGICLMFSPVGLFVFLGARQIVCIKSDHFEMESPMNMV